MDSSWEDTFASWAKPLSDTEQTKAENAERAIRDAIDAYQGLGGKSIAVIRQGSYRARTNIRQDSDVDICVCLNSTYFYDLPSASSDARDYGIYAPGTGDNYADFKNLVENALVGKFGRSKIVRGNKAFDIHENTYRLDADVLAAFKYRRFIGKNSAGNPVAHEGVKFFTEKGQGIVNWPEQNYQSGVDKNSRTGQRFKALVRILKNLRNYMQEYKIQAAQNINSSLIESLVWNVPDEGFGHDDYTSDLRYVLAHTFNATLRDETCSEWVEINKLKYLFRSNQSWTREQAHAFLSEAWNFVGFE